MKKIIKSIASITLVAFVLSLIFSLRSFAFVQGELKENEISITAQTTYLNNDEATIAIALKNSNVFGENSNLLTKETLKSLIQQNYGKDLLSKVTNADGTEVVDGECVGTGYKVELVTNKKLTVILYGDVNCDGKVDTNDSVAIAQSNVGLNELNNYQKKAAKLTNPNSDEVSTNDSVRLAYYNVDALGTETAGKNIIDKELYPANEDLDSGLELLNVNDADEAYKTALSAFTNNKFTANNEEIVLGTDSLTGTVNSSYQIGKELFPEDELTGYYFAYVIKAKGANENTTVKIKNGDKNEKEISYQKFDVTTDGEEGIVILSSLNKSAINKTIKIVVDLDGDGTLYKPFEKTINYENLQYQDVPQATISTVIPEEDQKDLKDNWHYRFEFSDSEDANEGYRIVTEEEKNKYKATGIITKQDKVTGFSENAKTDYYIVFAIEPSYVDENIRIKIPRENDTYLEVGKEALEDGKLTAIISVKENTKNNPIKIKVDLDGTGSRFEEEEIVIDYSELKFEKSSEFKIQKELPQGKEANVKEALDKLGFTPEEYFDLVGGKDNLVISADEGKEQYYNITGVVPKMTEVNAGFEGEDEGGYYIVFTVKMNSTGKPEADAINDNVKVTFTSPAAGDDANVRELEKSSFDSATEMAVLWKLDETRDDKTLKVTIDLDGEGTDYAPYHVILDYTNVVFQEETTADISIDETNIPEADKQQLKEWGYKLQSEIKLSTDNENLEPNKKDEITYDADTGLLSGIVKEQKLTSGIVEDQLDSYFYTFTVTPKVVTDDIKLTITNGTEPPTTLSIGDSKEGKFTFLQHIPKNFTKCTEQECCNGTGKCTDASKCKNAVKITIDSDGDSEYGYKPSETYYIDFCNVDLIDLHTVTFKNQDGTEVKDGEQKAIAPAYVYDGEKVTKPSTPVKEQHSEDAHQYNTFAYWRTEEDDYIEAEEFEFSEEGLSNEPVTEDINLYPMWDIDVDQYITDAISKINEKPSVNDKFKLSAEETENIKNLKVKILHKEEKISTFSDTGIASTIAHALASGEIDTINIELDGDTTNKNEDFSYETIKQSLNGDTSEDKIKEKVVEKLKSFFNDKIWDGEDTSKTLDDLSKKCSSAQDGLKIEFTPEDSVAKIEGMEIKQGKSYSIEFEEDAEIFFDTGDAVNQDIPSMPVEEGGTVTDLPEPTIPTDEEGIREFIGWYTERNELFEEGKTVVSQDITLKAHYNLNVDKFVDKVIEDLNGTGTTYSDDFSGKFTLARDDKNITIDIDGANVKLTDLAKTSIPGSIAYILQKGEIPDITLEVSSKLAEKQTETFNKEYNNDEKDYTDESVRELLDETGKTLKKEIIDGCKSAFDKALNNNEATATLDQLEYEDVSFSLKIGDPTDETITLVSESGEKIADDANKTYTFNFDSDFVVVDPDEELGADTIADAVVSENDYSTIYIDKDEITVESPVTIDKNVTIESLDENAVAGISAISAKAQNTVKMTGEDQTNIFVVNPGYAVTIANLCLSGTTTDSAIRVEQNSSLNAYGLTYDKETYNTPTIKAAKESNTVTLKENKDGQNIQGKTTKEKITKFEQLSDKEKSNYCDKKETDTSYNYTDYYSNDKNSKIYSVKFNQYNGPYRGSLVRYCINGEVPTVPDTDPKLKTFGGFTYEGLVYTFKGYSLKSNGVDPISKQDMPAIDGSNKEYYVTFDVSQSNKVAVVGNSDDFKAALTNGQIEDIYIKDGATIEYTENGGVLELSKSIIGKRSSDKTKGILKVKQININTDKVTLDRLQIKGTTTDDATNALINISNADNFTLYSSDISNEGSGKYTDAVKMSSGTKIDAQIMWNNFNGKNIKNFINLDGEVAGKYDAEEERGFKFSGTDIYMNTFKNPEGLDGGEDNSDIIIKKFSGSSSAIRIASNDFSTRKYHIRLSKEVSGQTAELILNGIKTKVQLGLEVEDGKNDFSNIDVKTNMTESDSVKIEQKYIGTATENAQQAQVQYGIKEL